MSERDYVEDDADNVIELDCASRRAAWLDLRPREIAPEDWDRYRLHIEEIFGAFGMDGDTPGTRDTPERYLRALFDATAGYEGEPKLLTAFPAEGNGHRTSTSQIIEGPIAFQSLCEHHALPFHGFAHIGYIAGEQIIGISKLTRLVRLFARRFTVQERLGEQIADGLVELVVAAGRGRAPRGVAPLHADAGRRGALAHDHDVLARRLRGSRAAARVPARSPQQRPPLTMADLALVCGGSGVLGGALVEAFTARGDEVVVADRIAAVSGAPGVTHEAVDLTAPDDVEALWDRLDHAAALGRERGRCVPWRTAQDSEPDDLRFLHDVNVGTAWWSCRAAARRLGAGDAIVNVAARNAVSGGAGSAAYTVAKAGVVRMTQLLADDLAGTRVRVNAVLPSVIDTPANRASRPADEIGKAVQPSELASVVAFLCSDAASAVTGAIVPVYGWA